MINFAVTLRQNIFNNKFTTIVRTVAAVALGCTSAWGIATTPAIAVGFTVTSLSIGSLAEGSVSTINGITYLNQTLPINSLSANSVNWIPSGASIPIVTLRRGGYAPTDNFGNFNNRQVLWAERFPGDLETTVRIPIQTTTQAALSQNNILLGTDNLFVNTGFVNGIQTDIERADFTISGGVETSANQAIAILERGPNTAHDPFQIAPILSIDSAGNPTSYGDLLSIPIGWGQTNLRPGGAPNNNLDYTVLTNSSGTFTNVQTDQSQQVGGLLIPLSELSPTPTTIYGYSLFSPDVNDSGNPANLLDWTNAAVFPQDTPNTVGGIDLVAANLGVLKAVPEPSSIAEVLLFGVSIAAWKLKKKG